MNENEIWLPVVGFEGLYEVSNLGKVKSLKFGKEKILIQVKMKNGYLYVNLYKEGKVKTCRVHRLVCQAFLDNPNGYTCVNHKDECKTNNRVDNLEWCDNKYNANYKNAQARRIASTDFKTFQARKVASTDWKAVAEKLTNRQDLSKQVFQYTKNGTLVAIYPSVAECERNGYNSGAVSQCCRGERKSHKGYIWSYIPL